MSKTISKKRHDADPSQPILTFGNIYYPCQPTGDVSGQTVTFWGGKDVNLIQIGDTSYGERGGGQAAQFVMPANGQFNLLAIETYAPSGLMPGVSRIGYLKIQIGNTVYQVGTSSRDGNHVLFNGNMVVQLFGIGSQDLVYQLQFAVVTL